MMFMSGMVLGMAFLLSFFFFFLLLGRFVGERERERKIELGRRFVLLVQFVKNVIRKGKTRGKKQFFHY